MPDQLASPSRKSLLGWGLRLVLSITILGITLWILPTREVWTALKQISPGLWLGVLTLFLTGHAVAAFKWWLLTDAGFNVPYRRAVRAHFAGLVANLCLPGVAGGDLVRAGLLFGESQNRTKVALGSLADRLLDTTGLALIALAGGLFLMGENDLASGMTLKLITLLGLGMVGAIGFAYLLPALIRRLPRLRAQKILLKIADSIEEMRKRPLLLVLCFALSVSVQCGFIALNIALARASGVEISVAAWYFAWPLAKILAIAPISVGGLGVREASLAGLLLPFGAIPAQVVAASLLWQTILFGGGLLGGLALLLTNRRALRPGTS